MAVQVGSILRLTARLRAGQTSTRVQNVFWWKVNEVNDPTPANIRSDFAAWLAAMYGFISGLQSTQTVAEGFRLNDVVQKETYGAGNWTYAGGNAASEMLPPQVSAELIGYTNESGRFGRKYLGPVVEELQADGTWDAAAVLALQQYADAWIQILAGTVTNNSYQPGVVRKVGAVYQFKEFSDDLGAAVIANARTQRRRTSGFGLT